MGKKIKMIGRRFGRLVVVGEAEQRDPQGGKIWICKCDCGETTLKRGYVIRQGKSRSCGCLHSETIRERNFKHGDTADGKQSKLHSVWSCMKQRCLNTNNKRYAHYGARGITIYEEWKDDYCAFRAWAVENGYKEGLSIHRINPDGNYEPSNCLWVTKSENSRQVIIGLTERIRKQILSEMEEDF